MRESLEAKIERNVTKFCYHDYVIWLRSYEVKSGGWVPRAVVMAPQARGNGEHDCLAPGTSEVATREEADAQAFTMGKQWVDGHRAGHPPGGAVA